MQRRRRLLVESLEQRALLAANVLFDFSDPFGGPDAQGFFSTGSNDEWHLSFGRGFDPGHSNEFSFYFGSGEDEFGNGQYSNFADGTLISPPIDLTSATTAELRFSHYLEAEVDFDFATVSVFDGFGSTVIAASGSELPFSTTGFESVSLDLTSFVGNVIELEFSFASDNIVTAEGWYVDDIIVIADTGADFGDAPTATQAQTLPRGDTFLVDYPTTLAAGGAEHFAIGPTLGFARDTEFDGQPETFAQGDDSIDVSDEDGLLFFDAPTSQLGATTGSLEVDLSNADPFGNFLDGWVDFNRDGDWTDPGEQILTSFDLGFTDGIQAIPFDIPQDTGDNVVNGDSFVRLRLSTAGGLAPTGFAADGEVEDHLVLVQSADTFTPIPAPVAIGPPGALIYDPPINGDITVSGEVDSFSVSVDPDVSITAVLTTDSSLQGQLDLKQADGTPLLTETAAAAGDDVIIQTFTAAAGGEFSINVSGLSSTTGDYTLQIILNSAVEAEDFGGSDNDTTVTAQNISASFIGLAGGLATRGAVVGTAQAATDDIYRFALNATQSATLAVTGAVSLSLLDPAGTLIAAGVAAEQLDQVINNYVATSTGDHFAVISSDFDSTPYTLTVTNDADFDTENNSSLDNAQDITVTGNALGFVKDGGGSNQFDTPILNFDGQPFNGVQPPDPMGDIGIDYYVQALNHPDGTTVAVYNKSDGSLADSFILDSLAQPGTPERDGIGDPVVVFDHLANRWVLAEFTNIDGVAVYVSQTSDPTAGTWNAYHFATPDFPDYPKISVWPDGYYMTTSETDGSTAYVLDRENMLLGNPARPFQRFVAPSLDGFDFQALTPADLDGQLPPAGAPALFMRHRDDEAHNAGSSDPTRDFLEIWQLDSDFDTPANSSFGLLTTIATSEFDSDLCGLVAFSCFAQPGTGTTLDPLREVIMWRLQYRNFGTHETLVGNFVTDVDGTDRGGVRWFELRRTGGLAGSWTLHQEGTIAPDSDNRWMAAIAMDGDGNIAAGYNVSSGSTSPGIRYAGRLRTDPLGMMPQGEHTLVDGIGFNDSDRWGDYSAMSVDPVDDTTFWFTGEYADNGVWATRIGSFQLQPSTDTDFYSFDAVAGGSVNIETFTPAGGPLDPVNDLDPIIEVFGPGGSGIVVDDNSAGDGRNAAVTVPIDTDGTYKVRVSATGGTEGTYFLSVSDQSGADPAPEVISSSPINASDVGAFPATYTLNFSETVDLTSIDADDLLIAGVATTGVSIVDGDTLTFDVDPAIFVGDGTYVVNLPVGNVSDLQGTGNLEFTGSFVVDTTGPRVTSTRFNGAALPSDRILPAGPLSLEANFDEPLKVFIRGRGGLRTPTAADLNLINTTTGETFTATAVDSNPTMDQFTAEFPALTAGAYELTLISGDDAFEDTIGNDLDGEPLGPGIDGTPSGDGVVGGDYVVNFFVDDAPVLNPFQRARPLGSLVRISSDNLGAIHDSTDVDQYTFFAEAGEFVSLAMHVDAGVTAAVQIVEIAAAGASVGPGQPAILSPTIIPADGFYTISLSADRQTTFRLDVADNASIEAVDSDDGNELAIDDSLLTLGSGRFAVIGTSRPVASDIFGPFNASPVDYSADNLDPSLTWERPNLTGPDIHPGLMQYHVQQFAVDTAGSYDISSTQDYDGYLHLYQDTFDPLDQLTGLIAANDDGFAGNTSDILGVFLDPASTYFLVTSAFASGTTGTFTNTITGPGAIALVQRTLDPDIDEYTIDLTGKAGQPIDIVLAGHKVDFRGEFFEILDVDGAAPLDFGLIDPLGASVSNFDLGILDFVVPADGVYTIRLESIVEGDYTILVTDPLTFDTEPNDMLGDALRDLSLTRAALGNLVAGQTLLTADFSDGGSPSLDGFTIDAGPGSLWHLSTGRTADAGHSGPDSLYFGQGEDAAGNGNYNTGDIVRGSVTSPPIDLTAESTAELSFNYFLETEQDTGFDVAAVQVSIDGGSNFVDVGEQLPDTAGAFVNHTVDLSSFVGNTIHVRFHFDTGDESNNDFEGWYLDDVIVQTPNADDLDLYAVDLTTGDEVTITAQSLFDDVDNETSNTLDLSFSVLHPNQTTVVAFDQDSLDGKNAAASFTAPADGTYTIILDAETGHGEYFLDINDSVFDAIVTQSSGSTVISEDGVSDTISVALGAIPTADVDVTIAPDANVDLGAGVGNAITLTFTPADALLGQTVTISAEDDSDPEADPHDGILDFETSSTDSLFDGATQQLIVDIIDNDFLTPVIGSTASDPSNLDPIPLSVDFGGDVTDFVASDLQIVGGTVVGFSDDGGGLFSLGITPTADGTITVDIAEDAGRDLGDKPTLAAAPFAIESDQSGPITEINGPTGPLNVATFDVTIEFSESVNDFVTEDISLGNGLVAALVDNSDGTFTATIDPAADGTVTVDVAAGVASDDAGNGNLAATQFTIDIDTTAPTPEIDGPPSPTNLDPFAITIDFGEIVNDFEIADITVTGATLSNLTDNNDGTYFVSVNPDADAAVTLDIAAGVATDAVGLENNAANQYSVDVDTTAPTPTITGPDSPSNVEPFDVSIEFNEPVSDFVLADITVAGGSITSLSGSGASYTATIDADVDGTITVDVAADVASDAAGNANLAANQFAVDVDTMAPTPVISGPDSPTNSVPLEITIDFGETVDDFVVSDITVSGGSVTELVDTSDGTFTATIDPDADGRVSVDVSADVASDAAGNSNTAALPFSVVVDTTPPEITVPDDLMVDANIADGAEKTLTAVADFLAAASATDDGDPSPTLTNDAPDIFPAGDTTVTWTATDALGHSSTATAVVTVKFDYGDAPTAADSGFAASYPVTFADDGARHAPGPLFLGTAIDSESDGQPDDLAGTDAAGGDDNAGTTDDEDGVISLATLVSISGSDTTSSFQVIASAAGKLDAWIDYDQSGSWEESEQIFDSIDIGLGSNLLPFTIPAGTATGDTFARVRLSNAGDLDPTGAAADGEVEDYVTSIADGSASPDVSVSLLETIATLVVVDGNIVVQGDTADLFSVPIESLGQLMVGGGDIDNVITLDGSGGSVVPPGGLKIDGYGGNNALRATGGQTDLDFTEDGNVEATNFNGIDLSDQAPQNIVLDAASVVAIAPTGRLVIIGGTADQGSVKDTITLEDADDWRMGATSFVDGRFIREVTNVAGSESFDTDFQQPWRHVVKFGDVNNNGRVTAGDANIIITELGQRLFSDRATGILKPPGDVDEWPGFYFDHSGDNRASALDALRVINDLALIANTGSGGSVEEEWIVAATGWATEPGVDDEGLGETQLSTIGNRKTKVDARNVAIESVDRIMIELAGKEERQASEASSLDDVIEMLL